jgi:hypothetical protein
MAATVSARDSESQPLVAGASRIADILRVALVELRVRYVVVGNLGLARPLPKDRREPRPRWAVRDAGGDKKTPASPHARRDGRGRAPSRLPRHAIRPGRTSRPAIILRNRASQTVGETDHTRATSTGAARSV